MSYVTNLFNGRNGRFEYWMVHVFMTIGLMLVLFIAFPLVAGSGTSSPYIGYAFTVALWLLVCRISLPVTVRRLHDRGKSGRWALLYWLAPLLINQGAGYISNVTLASACLLIAFLISLVAFIELAFLRGTRGPNEYGEDPVAPAKPVVA